MPRLMPMHRALILSALAGTALAAGCGGDQPAATPPMESGKMEPAPGKMDKMEPSAGKMEPAPGKMEGEAGKMEPK